MAYAKSHCPHVNAVRGTSLQDIELVQRRRSIGCSSCGFSGPNLWLCLHSGCLYVGCGESKTDHSSSHAQLTRHPLTLNITTQRIWCYRCECEVFVDSNHPPLVLKTAPSVSAELERERFLRSQPNDSDSDVDDRSEQPRGLTGLCNIGNTCYMNSALQALSNCPPLTRFFIDCPSFIPPEKKLARSYMKLMHEMWHRRRPNYVVPSSVASAVRQVHPMFRGFLQHDSQEFLRCVMDYLHEELKQSFCVKPDLQPTDSDSSDDEVSAFSSLHLPVEALPFSDTDYETCDSGLSSEHSSVAFGGIGAGEGANGTQPTDRLHDLGSEPIKKESVHQVFGIANHKGSENNENAITAKSVPDGHTVSLESQCQLSNDISSNVPQSCNGLIEHSPVLSDGEAGELETAKYSRNFLKTSSSSLRELNDEYERSEKLRSSPLNIITRSECKKPKVIYCSVISDIFDGEILSSVQCMTCHRISCTNETFQDLSLPIPNKDHLAIIRASSSLSSGMSVPPLLQKAACVELQQKPVGWFAWMYGLVRQIPGWLWGPAIRLQDCLAAFFSADDLKGENMYSCEKCKKLRNGIKYSRVLKLPEVLCIHLKRFRHEYMYSSKISSFVSFPMEGFDMRSYLHKDCKDQVTIYNLVAVICHHGTAGGGHYTTYGFNHYNQTWYEFDDQVVTEVDLQQVENCEAYVLFYRKIDEDMIVMRQKANQIIEMEEVGFVKFYISRQWINKFNTFAEPGPINNYDFLCRHGDVQPKKWLNVSDLAMEVPQMLWDFLHQRYGGGPAVNHLSQCQPCLQDFERLKRRQQYEMEKFVQLHEEFELRGTAAAVYALNMAWFREWENFVRAKTDEPPGPIDNSKISITKGSSTILLMNSDHGQMSEDIWNFFRGIYGGGPELLLKQSGSHKVDETGDTKLTESTTRQITST